METKNKKLFILKMLLSIVGGVIALFIVIFIALMVYYLWQLKFGDPQKIQELSNTFAPKFTYNNNSTSETIEIKNFSVVKGIMRKEDPTQGPNDAPITIVAFIDFQCSFSKEGQAQLKDVIKKYGPAAQIIFKHLPVVSLHPNAMMASLAATCAQEQGKFWEYHDLLFKNPENSLAEDKLVIYADNLKLDLDQFKTCLDNKTYQKNVEQDMIDAVNIGVKGTPTYLINTDVIEGVVDMDTWDKTIIKNLK